MDTTREAEPSRERRACRSLVLSTLEQCMNSGEPGASGATAAQEFVLIRQYRHGIAQVHLELAAGVADAGVSLLENAQRELLEETGFGGGDWRPWMSTSANPGTHTNTAHVFLATGVEKIKEQELEDTEDIAVSVLNAEQMLEALRGGQVFQSMHAAALWRYFAEIA
jgi:8-oxo-dGTP pyrophosphatase MutT (NUDIX family)